jgi:hypothetical protein
MKHRANKVVTKVGCLTTFFVAARMFISLRHWHTVQTALLASFGTAH